MSLEKEIISLKRIARFHSPILNPELCFLKKVYFAGTFYTMMYEGVHALLESLSEKDIPGQIRLYSVGVEKEQRLQLNELSLIEHPSTRLLVIGDSRTVRSFVRANYVC